MDRDEVGMISKKRKVDGDTPNLEGEGSFKVVETQSAAAKFMEMSSTDCTLRVW